MELRRICSSDAVAALAEQFDRAAKGEAATAIVCTTQRNKDGVASPAEWHVSSRRRSGNGVLDCCRTPRRRRQSHFRRDDNWDCPLGRGSIGILRARSAGTRSADGFARSAVVRAAAESGDACSGENDRYRFAVCFIDLDGFKAVNDAFGHLVGDRVLCEVARRLVGSVRPGDMAARFGGDEFTVFLDDLRTEADAAAVARRILDRLQTPVTIDGREVTVSASVGVALSSADCRQIEDLLRCADRAMYQAKSLGGGRQAVFLPHES